MLERNEKIMLKVEGLTKYFETPSGRIHSVDSVSFTINKGETLGLVGESGCGKSTTARTIIRLYEPDAGKIIFNCNDITHITQREMLTFRKKDDISRSLRFIKSQNDGRRNYPGAHDDSQNPQE